MDSASREEYAWLVRTCTGGDLSRARAAHVRLLRSPLHGNRYLQNLVVDMYGRCGSLEDAERAFTAIHAPNIISWNIILKAYALNGHIAKARHIFDQVAGVRNLVSWNSMLAAYAGEGHIEQAESLFNDMPVWNSISLTTMLSLYLHDADKAESLFNRLDAFREFDNEAICFCNVMIVSYARDGHIDKAKHLFDTMPQRDITSWTSIITALSANNQLTEAVELFFAMPQHNVVSLNAMVTAYAQSGYVHGANQVFNEMPEWDVYSWNGLLSAFCHSGEHGEAVNLFNVMPEHNIVSWNSMIAAYAIDDYRESRRLFAIMPQRSAFSWSIMISAYGRHGVTYEAKSIYDEMPTEVQVDIVSLNSLLSAFVENGQFVEASTFFEEMPKRDIVSWTLMITANAEHGDLHEAKRLLDTMPCWSITTWNAIVTAYAQNGQMQEARRLFDAMPFHNIVSWNTMVTGYATCGQVKQAKNLLKCMPVPSLISTTAVVQLCMEKQEIEEARAVFESIPPCQRDSILWNSMMLGYARAGHMDEARIVFDNILDPNASSWNSIIGCYGEHGYVEEARSMFEMMSVERDISTWNVMLSCYTQFGHTKLAWEMFHQMPLQNCESWTEILTVFAFKQKNAGSELALELFRRMQQEGWIPSQKSFTVVLVTSGQQGSIDNCRSLFCSINGDYDMQASGENYSCVVDALGRAGHLDRAQELVENMPHVPSFITWTTFLAACRLHGDMERGAVASEHILRLKSHSTASYVLLSNMFHTL